MDKKMFIINLSASDTSKRMRKRAKDIMSDCNVNTFELDRLSNGWPEESKAALSKLVNKTRNEPFSFDNAFTDVVTLRNFLFKKVPKEPRSNRIPSKDEIKDWLKPSLGHCAIKALPRIDLGAPNQQVFRDHLVEQGYGASPKEMDLARYERLSAFGVTYASMFVKQTGKLFDVDQSGKRKYVGPARIITAVLGNNNLDKFVGKFDRQKQARGYENVPKEWMDAQKAAVDAYVEAIKAKRRSGDGARLPKKRQNVKSQKPRAKNVPRKPRPVTEKPPVADEPKSSELRDQTNKILRQLCKENGLTSSGVKADLVYRLEKNGVFKV